jgi:hypothetical protein
MWDELEAERQRAIRTAKAFEALQWVEKHGQAALDLFADLNEPEDQLNVGMPALAALTKGIQ